MNSTHGYSGTGIPQSATEALLDIRAAGRRFPQNGIRCMTVCQPLFSFADDIAAQVTEIARSGQRFSVWQGDDGGHPGRSSELVLEALNIFKVEQLVKGNLSGVVERAGQGDNPLFQCLLQAFSLSHINTKRG